MPKLLGVARKAAPQLWDVEDWWLLDPRLIVKFPLRGRRLAFHPGPFINPLQILRAATMVAEAIDPFILDRHGFRLSDLVEAALAYSDHCLSNVRPSWPVGRLPRDAGEPEHESLKTRIRRIAIAAVALNDSEVEAASIHVPDEEWQLICEVPAQAAAAWAWATRPADALQLSIAPIEPMLGSTLNIRTDSGERPLPVALVLDALTVAVAELGAEAAADEACRSRLQEITELRALAVFDQRRGESFQNPRLHNLLDDHKGLVTVAVPDSRHAFVIGVASGLDLNSIRQSIEEINRQMDQFDAPSIHRLGDGFDPRGAVFRVTIYGGPVQMSFTARRDSAWIHVDDVVNMAIEANESEPGQVIGIDYIFQFLDELSTTPGIKQLLAFDFDYLWRHWLEYGVLNVTGMKDVALHPNPVPDQRHWVRAAAWEPFEAVLTAAGFPPSWDWFIARLDKEPGQATVGYLHHLYQVIADPPLILHTPIDLTLGEVRIDPVLPFHLAGSVILTIVGNRDVARAFTFTEHSVLVCDLIVERRPMLTPDGEIALFGCAATVAPRPYLGVKLGLDWFQLLARDSTTAHNLLGDVFLAGLVQISDLADSARLQFLGAWRSAPPVLLLEAHQAALGVVYQGRTRLPRSPATRGRARRALARAIINR
ncbi:MAG: hypothetical protein M1358_02150, partial [Chloroflexi bacterium]|nr:hypothetical protein [Chloroflexota bacterium]